MQLLIVLQLIKTSFLSTNGWIVQAMPSYSKSVHLLLLLKRDYFTVYIQTKRITTHFLDELIFFLNALIAAPMKAHEGSRSHMKALARSLSGKQKQWFIPEYLSLMKSIKLLIWILLKSIWMKLVGGKSITTFYVMPLLIAYHILLFHV